MSEKININQGETDVKNNIIDFSTLETAGREDDRDTWNSMQLFGESDGKEADYKSPTHLSSEAMQKLKTAKSGRIGAKIFDALNMKAA